MFVCWLTQSLLVWCRVVTVLAEISESVTSVHLMVGVHIPTGLCVCITDSMLGK